MKAIITKNLSKSFGKFTAVNKVNLDIDQGEIFAFLGPNGAGKSTTIKMLTTVLTPTSGKIIINNHDGVSKQDEVRGDIGVIFQDPTLDDELTAYENMYYHTVLYGVPKRERKKKIEELLSYVGLLEKKNDFIKTFSGGMKRRIEIARGLLHSPKILFLDEPTNGLDVQTRSFLWKHIKKFNKEKNITIFFTTHNMEEAEKVAKKIAIIDKGEILILGSAKEIKKKTKTDSLENAFLKLTGKTIREQNAESIDKMRRMRRR